MIWSTICCRLLFCKSLVRSEEVWGMEGRP